ncbi:MAG: oxidoreductase [Dermatophilaceae bacterium]|nr:oxidoreductase [Dermatophilaceae bacterium]
MAACVLRERPLGPGRRVPIVWRVATVRAVRAETPKARTIALDVPGWPGHVAGQHVDVRLTAEDGYTATRSYSIASVADGRLVEITVERLDDGEVSPYLVDDVRPGDQLEVRGPVGGWFVWRPAQTEPVLLVGGGSGVVPLMAMVRAHQAAASTSAMRLVHSVRTPAARLYDDELAALPGVEVTHVYTRESPDGDPVGRLDGDRLAGLAFAPGDRATTYVCGPTGFVETVADLLVGAGHDPARVRTERFGPSGGSR